MSLKDQIRELKKMYEDKPTLETLADLREVMVEGMDANDAYEGFMKVFTELYPDNAHYILELLQNARDANKDEAYTQTHHRPSVARFILGSEGLEFEHTGWRLFSLDDINAITKVGGSPKTSDPTNIGKFGIGFKSVFTITDRPEICSGGYHFAIERMFVPRLLDPAGVDDTRFTFPFKSEDLQTSKAISDISKELRSLGSETLLFLNEIGKIEYLLPDGNTLGYMERKEKEGVTIIDVDIPHTGKRQFRWLRYIKNVEIVDESNLQQECQIAIAFMLKEDQRRDHKGNWQISEPENGAKVCIYFPASKEKSNLRFHIHAPFASTVARDSIRTIESNRLLIEELAHLSADAIIDISNKHRALLTVEFLGLLPNSDDDLTGSSRANDKEDSISYEPIREEILGAFRVHPLVPTKSGDLECADRLFRDMSQDVRVSSIIDDNDLVILTKQPNAKWVTTNRNIARANRFLDDLGINEWGVKELTAIFSMENDTERRLIEDWVSTKPDIWLLQLFALLSDLEIHVNTDYKIVRTTKGIHVRGFEAYFTPEPDETMPYELNFVMTAIYESANLKKRSKSAREFLDIFGVQLYNEKAKVVERLKRYRGDADFDTDERYFEDICFFVNYLAKHPKGSSVFANESFLIGECNGSSTRVTPAQLRVIPSKLRDEVSELQLSIYEVWDGYNEIRLGKSAFAEWDIFLERIGVKAITLETLIKARAKKYYFEPGKHIRVSESELLSDTDRFLELLHDNYACVKEALSNARFFKGSDNYLHKASEICVGVLSRYSSTHRMPGLSGIYNQFSEQLTDFLIELGATSKLSIIVTPSYYSWNDHTIENLDGYLSIITRSNDMDVSFLIWEAICNCSTSTATHVYTAGWRDTRGPSTLVSRLVHAKWIPQVEYNANNKLIVRFVEPAVVRESLLPERFVSARTSNSTYISVRLFDALEIGKSIISQKYNEVKETEQHEDALRTLGLTEEEVALLSELRNQDLSLEEAREAIKKASTEKKRRASSFPTADAPRPENRREKVAERYKHSTPVASEFRPSLIRSTRSTIDPRAYLEFLYTNDDNEVICQLCKLPMPFKKRDGKYYFEAVEAFKPILLSNEHESKFLMLCPTCSAKYNEFIRYMQNTATPEMEELFQTIGDYYMDYDVIEIPIVLGDETTTIRFVQKHFIDLNAIIEGESS